MSLGHTKGLDCSVRMHCYRKVWGCAWAKAHACSVSGWAPHQRLWQDLG
jgi:hypothetical protein